jgi:hypothetical protein
MAVTINTGTLSTNCKYLSYGASTVAADAKTFLVDITETLIEMGWTRFDTAGVGLVLGTDDNCTRVIRRPTADNATSGNYQYLGITISQGGTANSGSNYRLQFNYAADWTDAASAIGYSNPIRLPHGDESSWWKNDAGGPYVETMLGYSSAGTIWLFNSDNATTFVFTNASQVNDGSNVFFFGEYNKSFGENMPSAGQYIHNGISFNGRELCDHAGANRGSTPQHAQMTNGYSYGFYRIDSWNSNQRGGSKAIDDGDMSTSQNNFAYQINQRGYSRPQFVLTEYPTHTNGSTGRSAGRGIEGTPEAWNNSYVGAWNCQSTTRLHMGWLGWVGHQGPMAYCLSSYGAVDGGAGSTSSLNTVGKGFNSHFFNGLDYTWAGAKAWLTEFGGKSVDSQNDGFVIYEPSVSVGSTGRMAGNNISSSTNWQTSTYNNANYTRYTANDTNAYAGTNVKFSVMGKIAGMKMSMGFADNFVGFLDAATIPVDANGYFQTGGTDTDHWCIPLNEGGQVVMWMPK